ncbi:zinc finger protein 721-like isoform X2 [Ptychodera flava]|uniref:zinc finger protein 721-like isoform X2 n=1 Tax=Ptychodera flava TaxID=63121 RepID=UPI003969EBB6
MSGCVWQAQASSHFGHLLKTIFPPVIRCIRTKDRIPHYSKISMKPKDLLKEESIPMLGKLKQLFEDCGCDGAVFLVRHAVFLRDLIFRGKESRNIYKESDGVQKFMRVIDLCLDSPTDTDEATRPPISKPTLEADVIEISDSETDSADSVIVESPAAESVAIENPATAWCVENGVLVLKAAEEIPNTAVTQQHNETVNQHHEAGSSQFPLRTSENVYTVGDLLLPSVAYPGPQPSITCTWSVATTPNQLDGSAHSSQNANSGSSTATVQNWISNLPGQNRILLASTSSTGSKSGDVRFGKSGDKGNHQNYVNVTESEANDSNSRDSGISSDNAYSRTEAKRKAKKQKESDRGRKMPKIKDAKILHKGGIKESIEVTKSAKFKQIKCKYCFAKFPSKMTLKLHLQVVHPKKVMKFSRPFPGSRTLITSKKPGAIYTCVVCQRYFSGINGYKTHMRLVHSNRNLFYCEMCNKLGFVRKYDLLLHRKSQHAKRPYRKSRKSTRETEYDTSSENSENEFSSEFNSDVDSHEDQQSDGVSDPPVNLIRCKTKKKKKKKKKRRRKERKSDCTEMKIEDTKPSTCKSAADELNPKKRFKLPKSCYNLSINNLFPAVSLTKIKMKRNKVFKVKGENDKVIKETAKIGEQSSSSRSGVDDATGGEDPWYKTRIKQEAGLDVYQGMFTCPYCNIIFPDTAMYMTHRNLHCHDNPFKCRLCLVQCSDKYDFQKHRCENKHVKN